MVDTLKKTEFPRCLMLKQIREEMGLSQKDLAMLLAEHGLGVGVSSNYISRFECGLQKPWKKARNGLAQALGVTEESLFPETL